MMLNISNNRFIGSFVRNNRLISSVNSINLKRSLATVNDSEIKNDELNDIGKGRFSSRVIRLAREGVESGVAHFKVGGKELYFPKARVILLRPNSKHTPYQAKFIVPKSFNKLDLRDYLFHIYGLRAMNITTQLLHGRYTRVNIASPRYREPQIKKMTIEMAEPFIWPEEPSAEDNNLWDSTIVTELEKYREDNVSGAVGSDKFKPGASFGGAVGPYKPVAQPFVPKALKRKFINQKHKYKLKLDHMKDLMKLNDFVNK